MRDIIVAPSIQFHLLVISLLTLTYSSNIGWNWNERSILYEVSRANGY